MTERLPGHSLEKLLAVAAAEEPRLAPAGIPERYEIRREIGRGGMGVVYEAFDRQLARSCALKTIGAFAGDELRSRLAREALAAARLRHPHIAAVYDATPDFISMQLVVGAPIDAVPRGERRLLVELVRDACRALHHAHEQGIIHRDVKPSNLLVEGRHVFVVDFGLHKEIVGDASRSLPGAVLGTPHFMPPEQAQGRTAIDARSDVYALGATLHHCLTGAPPFTGGDLPALLRRVIEEEPRAPRVDRDLDLVILKCLAKEPERRYHSAEALAEDLDRWLASEPVVARRPSLAYRLRKLVQRRRGLLRAAAIAASAAVLLTALVLAPIALRESEARERADEAVALSEHAAMVLQDAAMFTRLGDLTSAHEALETGIGRAREFLRRHEAPRVRHLLSRLLRARGQPDLALAELELAIADDPALDEARFERGLLRAAQLELTEAERRVAVADLSTGIRSRNVLTSVDLMLGRAELLRLQGRHEAAMPILEEVLAYDPAHANARTSLSRAALALGDSELARHYALSATDIFQGHGPIYLMSERRVLPVAILGLDGALVDFTPQLADGPGNALAFAHRGLVQLRRALRLESEGSRDEASDAVSLAIADHDSALVLTDPPGAFNNRAVCHMQAERLLAKSGDGAGAAAARACAEADLSTALARDPKLAEAHFNSGTLALRHAELLAKLGRVSAAQRLLVARASLQRALALAPDGWPHRRACEHKLAATEAVASGK